MPEYVPGTPSWVDLSTPDADAAAKFYGEVMGWTTTEPTEETGGYRLFQQAAQSVAGVMPHMQEGQPTVWLTYVSVEDADATADRVKAQGGTVIVEPMDVLELGRMAVFTDPGGAAFGVWQPKQFAGADLVNQPTSLCWNELMTRDADSARSFYSSVFGWGVGRPRFDGAPDTYAVWEVDGNPVGGMMPMDHRFPAGLPPYWSVCFMVSDVDDTVAKATQLGATVIVPPMDTPPGRFAGMNDPQGANFTVMQAP